MPVRAGDSVGPYRILARIGEGGMGEVWSAMDTRLKRMVALKFSKLEFNERFEREARAVAALNHPHICTLYDLGPDYLVMEFVEGEPLRGPLAELQAIQYAEQILDALDAAHRKGIIHRDLKPANILITKHGVKLLDFGLARLTAPIPVSESVETEHMTAQGQIVGTLHYMPPEQLQGKDTDARGDLFAVGCVLYEMLTGRRAFDGASTAGVIAAILEREPAPLQASAPLKRILGRCLAKDPELRFQTARDLKASLEWAAEPNIRTQKNRTIPAMWTILAVASAILGTWLLARVPQRNNSPDGRPARFTVAAENGASYAEGRVSPDGQWLAFIEVSQSGERQLAVRRLDALEVRRLGRGAQFPFWSPDSRFIAFGEGGSLKKVSIAGGAPQTICPAPVLVGGTWNSGGTILFAGGAGGAIEILQVSANGGGFQTLTKVDDKRGESQHTFPVFLPDGRHFLYTIQAKSEANRGVYVGSLDDPGVRKRLLGDVTNVEYSANLSADSGYLLFVRGDALLSQRFSPTTLQLSGEISTVAEKVPTRASLGGGSFSISGNGLMLISSALGGNQVIWFDRNGKRLGKVGSPGLHFYPAISPNGEAVAMDGTEPLSFLSAIWLYPGDKAAARFTFIPSLRPLWSPDGRRIAFEGSDTTLYLKNVAGSESEMLLLGPGPKTDDNRLPCEWSKDGRFLIYSEQDAKTGFDLWRLPLAAPRTPTLVLRTTYNETCGALSPDSHWIAYASDEQGRPEIYVQALSEQGIVTGRKWQISYQGGTWPKWTRNGRELVYLDGLRRLVSAEVRTVPAFEVLGSPTVLFRSGIHTPDARFDVTTDGLRFAIPTEVSASDGEAPTLILNWMGAVKQ